MKAVILAGGFGTRISEETGVRPKPMIEIGGKPLLWHIMKMYGVHGITEFVVALGYKGYLIKEYFANYYLHTADLTLDIARNSMTVHRSDAEPWQVTLVDTGVESMTGGRIKRCRPYVADQTFCCTYGDGVSDVDISAVIASHRKSGALVTLTAVQPPGRFGALELMGEHVAGFHEKPRGDGAWVNGGFFVIEPRALDEIAGDDTIWEREPLERLARSGKVGVYRHAGFWQPLDTIRDKQTLEDFWAKGAPWRRW
ncbi:MAG TPA: glucose-1-phosphate cytidylyltransferase [Candidatus Baltobacteraceae bacterium]